MSLLVLCYLLLCSVDHVKYPFLQWHVHESPLGAHVAPLLHGFDKQAKEEHSDIAEPSSASLNIPSGFPETCSSITFKHLFVWNTYIVFQKLPKAEAEIRSWTLTSLIYFDSILTQPCPQR